MFMTNMLLWWIFDSVLLPLVIKPKILKEALQWRSERRAQVESYVVTSIKPNKRIEPTIRGAARIFLKGGAEVMEAKALKKKNCL